MKYTDRTIENKTVDMDGNEFFSVKFEGCLIRYHGGRNVIMDKCTFNKCKFAFEGAAGNTLAMLSGLYGGGFQDVVERTFDWIRNGQIARTLQ